MLYVCLYKCIFLNFEIIVYAFISVNKYNKTINILKKKTGKKPVK